MSYLNEITEKQEQCQNALWKKEIEVDGFFFEVLYIINWMSLLLEKAKEMSRSEIHVTFIDCCLCIDVNFLLICHGNTQ